TAVSTGTAACFLHDPAIRSPASGGGWCQPCGRYQTIPCQKRHTRPSTPCATRPPGPRPARRVLAHPGERQVLLDGVLCGESPTRGAGEFHVRHHDRPRG